MTLEGLLLCKATDSREVVLMQVYFPIQMYLSREKIPKFSLNWWLNNLLCTLALCISLMAGIGAVVSIINELKVPPHIDFLPVAKSLKYLRCSIISYLL